MLAVLAHTGETGQFIVLVSSCLDCLHIKNSQGVVLDLQVKASYFKEDFVQFFELKKILSFYYYQWLCPPSS